jgi:hypothetical protein
LPYLGFEFFAGLRYLPAVLFHQQAAGLYYMLALVLYRPIR